MAKTTTTSAIQRVTNTAYVVMKLVSLALGLPLALISLMAVTGLATDALWVHGVVALVIACGVPLFVADRLLPADVEGAIPATRGLVSDVLAVSWMVIAVLTLVVAARGTGPLLHSEAARLGDAGLHRTAEAVRWLSIDPDEDAP